MLPERRLYTESRQDGGPGDLRIDAKYVRVENMVVLHLVQAMLGRVSPNLMQASVELRRDRVVVHFAFAEDLPADRDDVANIGGEFRALRVNDLPGCPAEDAVFIERAGQRWPGADFRMVFGVKGW